MAARLPARRRNRVGGQRDRVGGSAPFHFPSSLWRPLHILESSILLNGIPIGRWELAYCRCVGTPSWCPGTAGPPIRIGRASNHTRRRSLGVARRPPGRHSCCQSRSRGCWHNVSPLPVGHWARASRVRGPQRSGSADDTARRGRRLPRRELTLQFARPHRRRRAGIVASSCRRSQLVIELVVAVLAHGRVTAGRQVRPSRRRGPHQCRSGTCA